MNLLEETFIEMSIGDCSHSFVTGSDVVAFRHAGGTKLYHFCPYDNGLSDHMDHTICFFANDDNHALDVLEQFYAFLVDAEERYRTYRKNQSHVDEDLLSSHAYRYNKNKKYLNAIREGKVNPKMVPTDFVFSVEWADGQL
jgi:hypothetical protein